MATKKQKTTRKPRTKNHVPITRNLKPWIIGLGALALFFIAKAKKKPLTPQEEAFAKESPAAQITTNTALIITDMDNIYDYKKQDGRWYARVKGATTWIDYEYNIDDPHYNIFLQNMMAYLAKQS